jgi:hypothetical protein
VSNGYRKFSSRFVGDGDDPKTFASFATFRDGTRVCKPYQDTNNFASGSPESLNSSVKVAKVAQVAAPEAAVERPRFPATGERYRKAFTLLLVDPPAHISVERWQLAVEDGRSFLAAWGEQADALGWTSRDLFGLDNPPADPHPSYSRLSVAGKRRDRDDRGHGDNQKFPYRRHHDLSPLQQISVRTAGR